LHARPGQFHPLHTAIAQVLDRDWLEEPDHYPDDLSHFIAPPHATATAGPPTATTPNPHPCTIDLTELGYTAPPPIRQIASSG
jgi:hypothetical protein